MLATLIEVVGQYGYFGIVCLLAIENLGIPVPTEAAYVLAQEYVVTGYANYHLMFVVLTVGHLLGAILSYWVGWRVAKGLHSRPAPNEAQEKLAAWYKKYGLAAVFAARLLGHVRPWSSFVAGIAEIAWVPFLVMTLLGTVAFNLLAMTFTATLVHYWDDSPPLRFAAVASFLAGFVVLGAVSLRRRWRKRRS